MKARVDTESCIANSLLSNRNLKLKSKFKDKAPQINSIPTDLKVEILLLLSDKSCLTLFFVSKDWMQFFKAVASTYLNSVKDRIEKATSCDTKRFALRLASFEIEYKKNRKSSPHFQTLMQLKVELEKLGSPLAKLLHYQKQTNAIMQAIAASYKVGSPLGSMVYSFLEIYSKSVPEFSCIKENWFKLAIFCAGFSENNSTGELISKALLELKTLEEPRKEPETLAPTKNPQRPTYFTYFGIQTPTRNESDKEVGSEFTRTP